MEKGTAMILDDVISLVLYVGILGYMMYIFLARFKRLNILFRLDPSFYLKKQLVQSIVIET
jgi:hypothetical protein